MMANSPVASQLVAVVSSGTAFTRAPKSPNVISMYGFLKNRFYSATFRSLTSSPSLHGQNSCGGRLNRLEEDFPAEAGYRP